MLNQLDVTTHVKSRAGGKWQIIRHKKQSEYVINHTHVLASCSNTSKLNKTLAYL